MRWSRDPLPLQNPVYNYLSLWNKIFLVPLYV
jgi:hypothetical protein